ncbi:uncharacterized protein [Diadema antillarum]|uniref:uncharacterized protein n=1 Tax=Diadema antillarum TaxID=105358 RepID=UPI003A88D734
MEEQHVLQHKVQVYMLFRSLVISILLYGCETWTILAESEKRIQAFESKCLMRLLGIHYWERKTNGPQVTLLQMVKRRKLAWFGHVTRHDCLSKTVMQGTVEGGRCRGQQRKSWLDNAKEWTALPLADLLIAAQDRAGWKRSTAYYSSCLPNDHRGRGISK